MSKIRSIEINDFRIYEGHHQFPFENENGICNLIVMYAPNGYGKTSFFDAIEWAISGEIRRFNQPILKTEIEHRDYSHSEDYSQDDQILLTNRKSYARDANGVIKINIENGKSLQRAVKPRKVQNQEFRFDYRAGEYGGDIPEAELRSLIETNMLSQDQIDSFLRFKSPEEKFNLLKSFWPEGEKATHNFKIIQYYARMLEIEKQKVLSEIDNINSQINQIINAEEIIDKINKWIEKIKENLSLDFAINLINNSVNEEVYASLISALATYIKRIENLIEENEKLNIHLSDISTRFAEYEATNVSLGIQQDQLKKLGLLSSLYNDLHKLEKVRNELQLAVLPMENEKVDLLHLKVLLPGFLNVQKNIGDLASDNKLLLDENKQRLSNIAEFTKKNQQLEGIRANWEKELAELRKYLNEFDDNFSQLLQSERQIISQNAVLVGLTSELEGIQKLIDEQNAYIAVLQNVIQTARYETLPENVKAILADHLKIFKECENDLPLLTEAIRAKEAELAKSGNFQDNLNLILTWGEQYVKDTNTSTCPLCKTAFADIDALIMRIRSDKESVLKIDEQALKLTDLKVARDNCESQKNEASQYILTTVNDLIKRALDSLTSVQSQKNITSNKIEDAKNSVEHANRTKASFDSFFLKVVPPGSAIVNVNIQGVKENLQDKIEVLTGKEQRLAAIISVKTRMINDAENKSTIAKNNIAINENNAAILQTDDDYKIAVTLIKKLTLSAENTNASFLQDAIKTASLRIEELNAKITSSGAEIDLMIEKISGNELQLQEEDIAQKKEELTQQIDQLTKIRSAFIAEYKQYVREEVISRAVVDIVLNNCITSIKKLAVEKADLEAFSIDLEVVQTLVEKNKNQSKLSELESRLPKIENALQQFIKAKATSVDYIDTGINNYFNKDTINKIYQRIEPHHNLNEIDFRPDVTDKGPSLAVKVKNENEELNAVLYLSAGQVNVLSLSIFLAKAIESGSESISTIFMDDPIQNLSDINILSFVDLIRSIIVTHNKQLVISTHDEKFFSLLKSKLPADRFSALYLELEGYGKLKGLNVSNEYKS